MSRLFAALAGLLALLVCAAAAPAASSGGARTIPLRSCGLSSSQEQGTLWASPGVRCAFAHRLDFPARDCASRRPVRSCVFFGFRCVGRYVRPEGSVTVCRHGDSAVEVAIATRPLPLLRKRR